jgi:hypothetical protein
VTDVFEPWAIAPPGGRVDVTMDEGDGYPDPRKSEGFATRACRVDGF